MSRLIFLKLGGSIITDKDKTNTPDLGRIEGIATAIKRALSRDSDLSLLVGHGSGSFGHHAAKKYGTRDGISNQDEWQGFTEVALRASELNRLVTDRLVNAGINALSISPLSSVLADNHQIISWDVTPIADCLMHGLVPVIYGDVILDRTLGGTILSTEELFTYLAVKLNPEKILLAGLEKGVWSDFPHCSQLITEIHPDDPDIMKAEIKGSGSIDVTGGMVSKVNSMISLVRQIPGLEIQIFSALSPETVFEVLMGEHNGTIIRNKIGES